MVAGVDLKIHNVSTTAVGIISVAKRAVKPHIAMARSWTIHFITGLPGLFIFIFYRQLIGPWPFPFHKKLVN